MVKNLRSIIMVAFCWGISQKTPANDHQNDGNERRSRCSTAYAGYKPPPARRRNQERRRAESSPRTAGCLGGRKPMVKPSPDFEKGCFFCGEVKKRLLGKSLGFFLQRWVGGTSCVVNNKIDKMLRSLVNGSIFVVSFFGNIRHFTWNLKQT